MFVIGTRIFANFVNFEKLNSLPGFRCQAKKMEDVFPENIDKIISPMNFADYRTKLKIDFWYII